MLSLTHDFICIKTFNIFLETWPMCFAYKKIPINLSLRNKSRIIFQHTRDHSLTPNVIPMNSRGPFFLQFIASLWRSPFFLYSSIFLWEHSNSGYFANNLFMGSYWFRKRAGMERFYFPVYDVKMGYEMNVLDNQMSLDGVRIERSIWRLRHVSYWLKIMRNLDDERACMWVALHCGLLRDSEISWSN